MGSGSAQHCVIYGKDHLRKVVGAELDTSHEADYLCTDVLTMEIALWYVCIQVISIQ
jgi:hypothetical protein